MHTPQRLILLHFYLIERFGSRCSFAFMLFLYLVVGALGVIVGGVIGDRFGRYGVIWISISGHSRSHFCCPTRTCSGPACSAS